MPRTSRLKPAIAIAALPLALVALLFSSARSDAQIPPVIPVAPTPVTLAPGSAPAISGSSQFAPGVAVPAGGSNVSVCGLALAAATGGQTITDSSGALSVTLTEPGTYSYGPSRVNLGQPSLAICHQQTNSTVIISTSTGRELARTVRDTLGRSTMDRIVAGARLTGAGSFDTNPVTAGGTSGSTAAGGFGALRPPSTGDAGLLRD